jgi:hypothetical protein
MDPDLRRDLALLRQLDHMHRRRVSPLLARPAFQRRLKFPDRRIAGTPDRVERDAGAGLTAVAFDLKPAISAVEALRDGRRGLRGPAIALHLDRPCFGLGAVGLAYGRERAPGRPQAVRSSRPRSSTS